MKLPAVVELQDTVAVWGDGGNVTLDGVIGPQVRPRGTASVNPTVPAKPFTAVTVIVEVPEEPTILAAGEVAAMVKSVKVKVAVVD